MSKKYSQMTAQELRMEYERQERYWDVLSHNFDESPAAEAINFELRLREKYDAPSPAFKAADHAGAVALLVELLMTDPSRIQRNELQLLACISGGMPYTSNKRNAMRNVQNAWGKQPEKRTESEQLLVRLLSEIEKKAHDAQLPKRLTAWLEESGNL